jgi:3-phenylpropionate/trans-cinnamate dioxygenase ferredoxin component
MGTMSETVRLCRRQEIDPGTARRFDIGSYRIALVRIDDDVYAIDDTCSHEDYSLSEGEVLTEECEIECWKHGSTFDLRTGEPQTLPATRAVAVYPVRLVGDDVMVDLP